MNGVSFKEAISIIDKVDDVGNHYPFDISFRTLNRNSKKGGRLVSYKNVVKSGFKKGASNKASLINTLQTVSKAKKNPNHHSNRTRNLMLENGEIKKIHIRLIDSVNGRKMYY